jgi:hypothetical protein
MMARYMFRVQDSRDRFLDQSTAFQIVLNTVWWGLRSLSGSGISETSGKGSERSGRDSKSMRSGNEPWIEDGLGTG